MQVGLTYQEQADYRRKTCRQCDRYFLTLDRYENCCSSACNEAWQRDKIDFDVSDPYRDHFAAQGYTYPAGRYPGSVNRGQVSTALGAVPNEFGTAQLDEESLEPSSKAIHQSDERRQYPPSRDEVKDHPKRLPKGQPPERLDGFFEGIESDDAA